MLASFTRRAVITGALGLCLSIFSIAVPAQSQTRPFQMSLLASTDVNIYNASVDIPIFTRNVWSVYQDQPSGRSIAWLPPDANLNRHNIDWKRIVAVYVDEPYGEYLKHKDIHDCKTNDQDGNGLDDEVQRTMATLQAMATALRAKAPSARFWVNFTQKEIELLLAPDRNCPLNQPYIDVISMDIYGQSFLFSDLHRLYTELHEHRVTDHQQLALVPGTYTSGSPFQTDAAAAEGLSGYFLYAAAMNHQCYLSLGPTGITGIYDKCPVWMVAGWIGGATPYPPNYNPIEHGSSTGLRAAWEQQFAIPRVDPTQTRRVRTLIPVLTGE